MSPSDACNFEVDPTFLEKLCTLDVGSTQRGPFKSDIHLYNTTKIRVLQSQKTPCVHYQEQAVNL